MFQDTIYISLEDDGKWVAQHMNCPGAGSVTSDTYVGVLRALANHLEDIGYQGF